MQDDNRLSAQDGIYREIDQLTGISPDVLVVGVYHAVDVGVAHKTGQGDVVTANLQATDGEAVAEVFVLHTLYLQQLAQVAHVQAYDTGIDGLGIVGHQEQLRAVPAFFLSQKLQLGLGEREITGGVFTVLLHGPGTAVAFLVNLIVPADNASDVQHLGLEVNVLPGKVAELADGDTGGEGDVGADVAGRTVRADMIDDGPLLLLGEEPELRLVLACLTGDLPRGHSPQALGCRIAEDTHQEVGTVKGRLF